MKVVHINIDDTKGGASIACQAINKAVRSIGVDSTVLVQKKFNSKNDSSEFVHGLLQKILYQLRFALDYFSILFLTVKKRGRFSFPFWGVDVTKHPLVKKADIIHLHWINGGFFSLKTFKKLAKLNKPVVWTLHDMWTFTGGCHYSGGCDKYLTQCKSCPSLKYPGERDLSSKIFLEKIKAYKNLNLEIVTCSRWLAGCAKKSKILNERNINAIPNPIDINIFKTLDKKICRKKFSLPEEKFLILFGTMNLREERKGFNYLLDGLIYLNKEYPDLRTKIEIVTFGSFDNKQKIEIPFKTNFLGRINDLEKLVQCYNTADVFIAPSLEDNLPNTVMESLACGIPVVAFNIGGMPDMIEHKVNGYLADSVSASQLGGGILWMIEQLKHGMEYLKTNAREKVIKNFTPEIIAKKYLDIYKHLGKLQ